MDKGKAKKREASFLEIDSDKRKKKSAFRLQRDRWRRQEEVRGTAASHYVHKGSRIESTFDRNKRACACTCAFVSLIVEDGNARSFGNGCYFTVETNVFVIEKTKKLLYCENKKKKARGWCACDCESFRDEALQVSYEHEYEKRQDKAGRI